MSSHSIHGGWLEMSSIDGSYISSLMTAGGNAQVDRNEFGSFSMAFDDEMQTKIYKISKDDADMYAEWRGLIKDIDKNTHYVEYRIAGGFTIGIMATAQISQERTPFTEAVLSAEDQVKINSCGHIPYHKCPTCHKPGEGRILGTIKTNARGHGTSHLQCKHCGMRYKI